MRYLGATRAAGAHDLVRAMQDLAAQGGPSPLRQIARMAALRLTGHRFRTEEFFTYALWQPDRGRRFLRDFLSNTRVTAFNAALNMPDRGLGDEVMKDKLATEALLAARGLPVTETRALYRPDGASVPAGLPRLRTLGSAAEIAGYLSDARHLPLFGKPRASQFALGAVAIDRLAGPGMVHFLSGLDVPLKALADEIVTDWPEGYLFQPFYQAAADLRRHSGAAMASIRIVTLWTDQGVEPWYAVIRLPARTAMHDGDATDARIWGLIDPGSGRILRLRNFRDPLGPDLTHALDASQPFLGQVLPHWADAVAICQAAHQAFPGNGIIGWDVFLTDAGALLNEANANPGHVYQIAAQRPLLNPDLRPGYDRALAFARRHGGGKPRNP